MSSDTDTRLDDAIEYMLASWTAARQKCQTTEDDKLSNEYHWLAAGFRNSLVALGISDEAMEEYKDAHGGLYGDG